VAAPRTNIEQVVQTLKNLAEPTRLRLVTLLGHGELTVGEICRVVGQSQPRVSRHLRLLTEAGLLDRFREQQRVYYRTPAGSPRAGWLNELLATVDPDDPALQHDRVRMALVVGDSEKLAATELGARAPADLDQAGLAAVLQEELGSTTLGELLDIGTGAGRLLQLLAAQAARAVGVDLSAPALRLARARLHGRALAHCEFHRGDMYALPFAPESFDTVTIDRVLVGAERPVAVLTEAARVLRRSGRLLVVERFDDMEACRGVNPLLGMREWLDGSALKLTRLRPCDLACGHYLLALAQHP
jgi:DNA-binding transcriptional ArsR family regulator/protein-L-isoaspartate O-methyltransferase